MKKITLTILSTLMAMALFTGCVRSEKPPTVDNPTDNEDVVVEPETPADIPEDEDVEEVNLTFTDIKYENGIITYTITNDSKDELVYGLEYKIEKMNGRLEWVDTELTKDIAFIEIANTLDPNGSAEDAIDISPHNLETGTYRIARGYLHGENRYIGAISFSVDETSVFEILEGVFIPENE